MFCSAKRYAINIKRVKIRTILIKKFNPRSNYMIAASGIVVNIQLLA